MWQIPPASYNKIGLAFIAYLILAIMELTSAAEYFYSDKVKSKTVPGAVGLAPAQSDAYGKSVARHVSFAFTIIGAFSTFIANLSNVSVLLTGVFIAIALIVFILYFRYWKEFTIDDFNNEATDASVPVDGFILTATIQSSNPPSNPPIQVTAEAELAGRKLPASPSIVTSGNIPSDLHITLKTQVERPNKKLHWFEKPSAMKFCPVAIIILLFVLHVIAILTSSPSASLK